MRDTGKHMLRWSRFGGFAVGTLVGALGAWLILSLALPGQPMILAEQVDPCASYRVEPDCRIPPPPLPKGLPVRVDRHGAFVWLHTDIIVGDPFLQLPLREPTPEEMRLFY